MLRSCRPKIWPSRAVRHGLRLLSSVPPITPVEKIIIDGIKATGPIPFATYMQMCLAHPTHGYYMNPQHPIFGPKGDFVTSPEVSSLFGEVLGIWFMSQWMQSAKLPIRVVELGPGRGTLMHDILRVVAQFGGDRLVAVHLVETSPTLRALQERRLSPSALKHEFALQWHDSVDQIPPSSDAYTMVVAHEFFDALPFHTIQKTELGWQEVLIALADADSSAGAAEPHPRFRYVLSPQPTAASTLLGHSSPRFNDVPVGARLEVSPAAFKIARTLGTILADARTPAPPHACSRGCALIVDYGAAHAAAQSFRAIKAHALTDPLHAPGTCDLTANVDFAYLAEAVRDLVLVHGPLAQGAFLARMGLHERVEALAVRAGDGDDSAAALRAAAQRLVDPAGMGGEYMMLALGGHAAADAGGVWPFLDAPAG
ncbi:S-adenosyl-L-methionine-dependent methyltransferase [Mycena pura]|uniref:Protein arginine methyltransferase NDUFAF7 n=1 Tax=Mycena pura TaxID=153505 RepID=A0AAD6Y4M6_9AGAR|nr:S-adenosyl-L-methionine-dependent methyltransferase [Mycena pura]